MCFVCVVVHTDCVHIHVQAGGRLPILCSGTLFWFESGSLPGPLAQLDYIHC